MVAVRLWGPAVKVQRSDGLQLRQRSAVVFSGMLSYARSTSPNYLIQNSFLPVALTDRYLSTGYSRH